MKTLLIATASRFNMKPQFIPTLFLVAFTGLLLTSLPAIADGRVAAWGSEYVPPGGGLCGGPINASGLSNVVAIASGGTLNLALTAGRQVVAWGLPSNPLAFFTMWSNIVDISAHGPFMAAVTTDGRVLVSGVVSSTIPTNIPPDLNDAVAVSLGGRGSTPGGDTLPGYCLALRSNHTIVAWASPEYPPSPVDYLPPGMTNITAVAAGTFHALALKADGHVVAWGSPYGQNGQADVPNDLNNVTAVAAGKFHSLALKSDGSVVAWGLGSNTNVPPEATNIMQISAGDGVSLALRADGNVIAWSGPGYDLDCGQLSVPIGFPSNIVAIACGKNGRHNLALYSDAPIIRKPPQSRSVIAGDNVTFEVRATSPGSITYQWRFNGTNIPTATGTQLSLTNVQADQTGFYDVVACSASACATSAVATLSFKVADVKMLAAVTVQGLIGANTEVQWSSDLATWNTLTNFSLPLSPFQFADWSSVGQPHRFYRVIFHP